MARLVYAVASGDPDVCLWAAEALASLSKEPAACARCAEAGAAATTLATEANGVSDNPLIFPEADEALSGGNFHAEPVAFAADMIALAEAAEAVMGADHATARAWLLVSCMRRRRTGGAPPV